MSYIKQEDLDEITLRQIVRISTLSGYGTWTHRGYGPISVYCKILTDEAFLQVRGENTGQFVLNHKIQRNIDYKKDKGRFITWRENDLTVLITFRSNDCCHVIWEHICEVQGKQPYEYMDEEAKTELKQEVKEEPKEVKEEEADDVSRDVLYEEMLDIEHLDLPRHERDIVEQLIEIVNKMVSPAHEDKTPSPAERRLLDLFHIPEDIEVTAKLEQLHKTILSLLSEKDKI